MAEELSHRIEPTRLFSLEISTIDRLWQTVPSDGIISLERSRLPDIRQIKNRLVQSIVRERVEFANSGNSPMESKARIFDGTPDGNRVEQK